MIEERDEQPMSNKVRMPVDIDEENGGCSSESFSNHDAVKRGAPPVNSNGATGAN